MNLVNELLKADKEKALGYKEGTFKSKRLAEVIGADEPVEIKIREIDMKTIKNIRDFATRRDGTTDPQKSLDSNMMVVVKGVTEPSLEDEKLQNHYGAANAMELAEILFRFEANFIADAIIKLSNMTTEDDEELIKN